jgi:CubicO group peptidase (beta-lactamase class C family)
VGVAVHRAVAAIVLFAIGVVTSHPAAPETPEHPRLDAARLERALGDAEKLARLHALIVARDGVVAVERVFRGPGLDVPVNVKSVSKSIVSALVGAAIDRGVLEGTGQPVAPAFRGRLPEAPDPRLSEVTVGHLLSMRAGLERTSGRNYGRWVQSPDWVRFVLARPFVDEPGGRMLYSTGNTHLLSALLTGATGRSTLSLAREWLGEPLGIDVPAWERDPQGVHLGGNNMTLSPRALLRFAELYRNGGVHEGRRVLPESWVRESWMPRARSPFSGDRYGYGWFVTDSCGRTAYYARGFGGQYVFVVPSLALSVVVTSDPHVHSRVGGYREALRTLVDRGLVAAAIAADRAGPEGEAEPCARRAQAAPAAEGLGAGR